MTANQDPRMIQSDVASQKSPRMTETENRKANDVIKTEHNSEIRLLKPYAVS